MLQAACKNFTTLAVLRALSGAAEACADPAFMLITSMWYTRREQPVKMGLWYTANGFGIALGGLLGYGIGNIDGALPSWKYEFIVMWVAPYSFPDRKRGFNGQLFINWFVAAHFAVAGASSCSFSSQTLRCPLPWWAKRSARWQSKDYERTRPVSKISVWSRIKSWRRLRITSSTCFSPWV